MIEITLPQILKWLTRVGIDTTRSWPAIMLACIKSLLFVNPPRLDGATASVWWKQHFPHVDLQRPRAGDLLRIPLQAIWLIFVKPPSASAGDHFGLGAALRRGNFGKRASYARAALSASYERMINFIQQGIGWDGQAIVRAGERAANRGYSDQPVIRWAAYFVALQFGLFCITTPFNTLAQALLVILLWSVAMIIRRIHGTVAAFFLIVLSVIASTRYLWWRIAHTLNWDESLDLFWGLLLLAAEVYTWALLLLGYFQTAWPLRRPIMPLPDKIDSWPSVDIYIPTYNEPLKVVKPTVFAALSIDWPADRLKVYLLDDGRREEFRQFAAETGVGYITRNDNRHAKAGNLNAALPKTSGEFIAIFDCDHIATRSFLQIAMGWFIKNDRLALIQTPHHFFSADPFERNLGLFRRVPNEGELFYGVVQDGNDLWNAAFFCGSCAVLRRKPLEEVGGIAIETVTEDAHTSLKMHRLGYTSAYLNIPQAAGLATESLSAHIGQRIRWARGMTQIFRLDNPFFGKGLSWAQRICYGNAMMHFLNGIPRLIFLTAPLAFLLFHAYVIYAPAISVALYVLPHMMHANITNSRMQGGVRHSFWSEVYETVLSWYIARPTLVALFAPRKGKFNVTVKGGLNEQDYFDWVIALPYLTIVGLNVIGFCFGVWRILAGPQDEVPTTILNLFWVFYNIVLLGGAIAVASESRQVRLAHRVHMKLPAILRLPDGKLINCHTQDFSESGMALDVPIESGVRLGDRVHVTLWRGAEEFAFPAEVMSLGKLQVRLQLRLENREQESMLVQCTFARADAWSSWTEGRKHDRPLDGLREIIYVGIRGYSILGGIFLGYAVPVTRWTGLLLVWIKSFLPRSSISSAE